MLRLQAVMCCLASFKLALGEVSVRKYFSKCDFGVIFYIFGAELPLRM